MELNITDLEPFDDQKMNGKLNNPPSALSFKEKYAKNRNLIIVKKSVENSEKQELTQDKQLQQKIQKKIEVKEAQKQELTQKQEVTQTIKPIPNKFARISRPQTVVQEPKVTYDDILNSIGITFENGKMYKKSQEQINQPNANANGNAIPQNSYIYNKYFKDELSNNNTEGIRRPKSINEYKAMLVHDILQKKKIRQIKSTKLIMPTNNIQVSSNKINQNFNKLFSFSKN